MATDKQKFQRGRFFMKGMVARILQFITSMEDHFIDYIPEEELNQLIEVQTKIKIMLDGSDQATDLLRVRRGYDR